MEPLWKAFRTDQRGHFPQGKGQSFELIASMEVDMLPGHRRHVFEAPSSPMIVYAFFMSQSVGEDSGVIVAERSPTLR